MTRMTKQTQAAALATAELSEEHRIILKVVVALRAECGKVERGSTVDPRFFLKAVDFIRNFADRFHHAKEEDILFPALDEPGAQMHCDPRPVMLENHELGRLYVRGMEGALQEGRKAELLENARGYCGLLEEHIYKEDNILYPMAEEALGAERSAELKERFAAVNRKFAAAVKAHLAFAAEAGRLT